MSNITFDFGFEAIFPLRRPILLTLAIDGINLKVHYVKIYVKSCLLYSITIPLRQKLRAKLFPDFVMY